MSEQSTTPWRLPAQYCERTGRVLNCYGKTRVRGRSQPVYCRKAYLGHDGPHIWFTRRFRVEWCDPR